jgi:Ribonuclease T2 family
MGMDISLATKLWISSIRPWILSKSVKRRQEGRRIGHELMMGQGLDTYKALAAAGILPSTSTTYTSDEIQTALTKITGSAVVLGCKGGRLDEAVRSTPARILPWLYDR